MDLIETVRTTGAVRDFTDVPVDHDILRSILESARFAPSGGNRQPWHVIVVDNHVTRRGLRDAYLDAWHDYVAHLLAGVVPFSPLANEADRMNALAQRERATARSQPTGFAESLDRVPALLVVCADVAALAATDRDLDRYHFIGGASIYPFVWNILLAARAHGLAGVMTTIATRNEPQLRELFHLPATFAIAAVVALGHPSRQPLTLSRHPVDSFTSVDFFDGGPL